MATFFDNLADRFKGLFSETSDGGVAPKDNSLADVPKLGFSGTTQNQPEIDIRQAVRDQSPNAAPASFQPDTPPPAVGGGQAFNPGRLSDYTNMPIEQIESRMTAAHYGFQAAYGFEPPESTTMAIATNPRIKDGAITSLFNRSPRVLSVVQGLKAAGGLGLENISRVNRAVQENIHDPLQPATNIAREFIPAAGNLNRQEEVSELLRVGLGREPTIAESLSPNIDLDEEQLKNLTPEQQERFEELRFENLTSSLPQAVLGAGIATQGGKTALKGSKAIRGAAKGKVSKVLHPSKTVQ